MLRRVLAVLVGVVCVVLVGAGSALGAVSHPFLGSFEGPSGPLAGVSAMAVDGATGDVYVSTGGVIDKFDGEGHYLCQVTGSSIPSVSECDGLVGSATPTGSFASPVAIAVDNSGDLADPSLGDLYVADTNNNVVDKFSPGGEYLGQLEGSLVYAFGVGVDGSGNVWVTGDATTWEYDSSGHLVFTFRAEGNGNVSEEGSGFHAAVDSNGFTYEFEFVQGLNEFGLGKFSPTGESLGLVDITDSTAGPLVASATDLSTDDVYADDGFYVAEYSSLGEPLVQFGAAQLGSGGGGAIAVNPVTGEVYVGNSADGRVYRFGATPGPRVMSGAATGVTGASATANGMVNPEGSDTTYRFEYGTSTSYGHVVPAVPLGVGSGLSAVPVSVALSGLLPGTTYHYRIVASNANGTVSSGDRPFTTSPAPSVDGAAAVNLTSTTADLTARINPNGFDTIYHFEWGTSAAYGTSVPVPDVDIGAGSGDVSVSVHLSGLTADTTYHWRVVARNVNGTTGVDHTFVYDTGGGGLPDGRVYELVTPAEKHGAVVGDVIGGVSPLIAEDGSRVIDGSIQCFADAVSCVGIRPQGDGTPFAFTRTAGGWVASALAPSAAQFENNTWWTGGMNPNAGTALFSAPTAPAGEEDWYARQSDGSFVDLGPLTPPSAGPTSIGDLKEDFRSNVFATADLSHVVYQMREPGNGHESLLEYVGAGNAAPALVGVRGGLGSTDLISACRTYVGNGRGQGYEEAQGVLSADGRVVFFTAGACAEGVTPVPVSEVFARVDNTGSDAHTVAISQPSAISPAASNDECTTSACVENTTNPARFRDAGFVAASADGSKVFFTSAQQLTDNASEDLGENLYEYDFSNPVGHNLVDVSAGAGAGGPRVDGAVALSPDGTHLYFIAESVLASVPNAEGVSAQAGKENLYVFERDASYPEGHVAFVAPAAGMVSSDGNLEAAGGSFANPENVTPDGRFLVFVSNVGLTPGAPDSAQVYRYDAQTGELVRISVGEHGFNDNGDEDGGGADARIVGPVFHGLQQAGGGRTDPTMSDDGAYVFFMSPAALTPGALNDVPTGNTVNVPVGYAMNVYEYHEGNVYLISGGRDTSVQYSSACGVVSPTCLFGTDATGANVFFSTAQSLVPQDTNTEIDIYDARICTSSEPCVQAAAPGAPCAGEGCRGAPEVAPSSPGAGSAVFSGAGNLAPAVSGPVVKPRALSRAQKLARALRACHADRARHKRVLCEAVAHRRFGVVSRSRKASRSRKGGK
jgi:hypothetical protein